MANTNGESGAAKRPLFRNAFRGYAREDVDAFLADVAKEVSQLQDELRQLRADREELAATAAAMEESLAKAEAHKDELTRLRTERENLLREIAALGERATKAETESAEKARRLMEATQERTSADPILRAAQETADRMLSDAKAQAERIVADAESRAAITLEDMRRKMELLRSEFDAAQAEYERFIDTARRHAQEFQRKLDERASDRYLS